ADEVAVAEDRRVGGVLIEAAAVAGEPSRVRRGATGRERPADGPVAREGRILHGQGAVAVNTAALPETEAGAGTGGTVPPEGLVAGQRAIGQGQTDRGGIERVTFDGAAIGYRPRTAPDGLVVAEGAAGDAGRFAFVTHGAAEGIVVADGLVAGEVATGDA